MGLTKFSEQAIDAVGISVSSKVTTGAGFTGLFAGMASWNWTAIIASAVALSGLAMNFYFQHRRDRREAKEQADRDFERSLRVEALMTRIEEG